ncbi:MAG TPA: lipase maturation factor family protein, partial [Sunxiuqinia sp.]|nr:lipase maturation factor family protein [Sunxiuqinia sp.]
GVWFNWLAEVVSPLFVFWPRIARQIAGVIIIAFQLTLILSGNLSFLNWLTIVPTLACFDDDFWSKILPRPLVRKAQWAAENAEPSKPMTISSWVVAVLIALMSIQPIVNLLSSKQIMNTSFDLLDLVNTYGAFGSVGKERYNVVYEGTTDDDPSDSANWKQYIYKGLPVKTDERPPQVAPYHLRFDWQMWFASMTSPNQYTWSYNLAWKLLHNDPTALQLFAGNPFPDQPPKYVRAVLYHYEFAKPGNPQGNWWKRKRVQLWLPVLSTDNPQLVNYLKSMGWIQK